MPKVVNREERRRAIAAAMWRVAYRDGWNAVSLRNVAAEAALSLGAVQHYFASIDDLIHYGAGWVRDVLNERLGEQLAALSTSSDPRAAVRDLLQDMVPNDLGDGATGSGNGPRWRVEVLAWLTLVGRAIQRPELGAHLIEGSTQIAQAITVAIRSACPGRTQATARRDAAGLLAMVEGILVQMAYGLTSPRTARKIIEHHVDRAFSVLDEE